jgi:hypothetical protein
MEGMGHLGAEEIHRQVGLANLDLIHRGIKIIVMPAPAMEDVEVAVAVVVRIVE